MTPESRSSDAFDFATDGTQVGDSATELAEMTSLLRAVAGEIRAPVGLRARRGALLVAVPPHGAPWWRFASSRARAPLIALLLVMLTVVGVAAATLTDRWAQVPGVEDRPPLPVLVLPDDPRAENTAEPTGSPPTENPASRASTTQVDHAEGASDDAEETTDDNADRDGDADDDLDAVGGDDDAEADQSDDTDPDATDPDADTESEADDSADDEETDPDEEADPDEEETGSEADEEDAESDADDTD